MSDDLSCSALSFDLACRQGTLRVRIYQVDDCEDWFLAVFTEDDLVTAWKYSFATDQEAHEQFLRYVAEHGVQSFFCEDVIRPIVH